MAVLREHFAVNVVQSRGAASVATSNWVGQLTPLHATSSGKVLLAHLDPDERSALLARPLERYTAHTHTDRDALGSELDTVAEEGHASSHGELEIGLNAVAVPVRGEDGRVIAALSASGPDYRLGVERLAEKLGPLRAGAAELSRRMGFWAESAD